MIYILTVHWENSSWINLQHKYIKKHTPEKHKIFSFLNIATTEYDNKFDYVSHENIKRHASKLNILADMACFDSSRDDDILIFIDGDAFPIKNYIEYVYSSLSKNTLIAVQRKENLGDIQPHPCFCAITVRGWKSISGNWNPGGAYWQSKTGRKITDLGGIILNNLEKKSLKWEKLLRSNKINLHPLHYGIYGDLVYHHGAGFRNPATRTDLNIANRKKIKTYVYKKLGKIFSHEFNKKYFRPMNEIVKKNKVMGKVVFDVILKDEKFYDFFLNKNNNSLSSYTKEKLESLNIIK